VMYPWHLGIASANCQPFALLRGQRLGLQAFW